MTRHCGVGGRAVHHHPDSPLIQYWDTTNGDGLDELPWDDRARRKLAEPERDYPDKKKSTRK